MSAGSGPLSTVRVVEFAGEGPASFAAMTLADWGADVIRVERPNRPDEPTAGALQRGKRLVTADLKDPAAQSAVLDLVAAADVLLEGFRPGVMERLGLGPAVCLERNERLVYGRMTGWGQSGPLAHEASHDPDNLAIVGALHAIGRRGGPPQLPLALVGDFGGGAMYLVSGVLAALLERQVSGLGQVIDAAIVDGVAHMMSSVYAAFANGSWIDERGRNLTDTGTPFVDVYTTADQRHMVVAALEPQFYQRLIIGLGLDSASLPAQWDTARWDELRAAFAEAFARRTQQEWAAVFDAVDACVAPVLSLSQALRHPHLKDRGTFIEREERLEPAPAPRFGRSDPGAPRSVRRASSLDELLAEWRDG